MLQNIFLLKGEDFQDLDNLSIYGYPQEIIKKDKDLIEDLAYGHTLENQPQNKQKSVQSTESFQIDEPIPLVLGDLNLSTMCLY